MRKGLLGRLSKKILKKGDWNTRSSDPTKWSYNPHRWVIVYSCNGGLSLFKKKYMYRFSKFESEIMFS